MLFNYVQAYPDLGPLTCRNPTLDYICAAISRCEHEITVGFVLREDAINLIPDTYYQEQQITDLLNWKSGRNAKIGILTTELYIDRLIPYGLSGLFLYQTDDNAASEALKTRLRGIYELVPRMDFIWNLLPRSAGEFSKYNKTSLWFPYGHAERLVPEMRRYPRDIDVLFVGKLTEHRKRVVEKMKGEGIDVTCYGAGWARGHLPDALMHSTLCRAKIGLNLTMAGWNHAGIDPRFVSCTRVVDFLERDVLLLTEPIAQDNPYSSFMIEGDAKEYLNREWLLWGNALGARFREEMPVEKMVKPVIDQTLAVLA